MHRQHQQRHSTCGRECRCVARCLRRGMCLVLLLDWPLPPTPQLPCRLLCRPSATPASPLAPAHGQLQGSGAVGGPLIHIHDCAAHPPASTTCCASSWPWPAMYPRHQAAPSFTPGSNSSRQVTKLSSAPESMTACHTVHAGQVAHQRARVRWLCGVSRHGAVPPPPPHHFCSTPAPAVVSAWPQRADSRQQPSCRSGSALPGSTPGGGSKCGVRG